MDNSHQKEESDDKLPDNILYVPAGVFYIAGGKCSTADVDTARSSNERLSMEGNYSTVDDDMPKSSNKRISMEGDYSTVDEDTRISIDERVSVEGNYVLYVLIKGVIGLTVFTGRFRFWFDSWFLFPFCLL
jgi:hypothetical protein